MFDIVPVSIFSTFSGIFAIQDLFGLATKTTATTDFNHDFSKPLVSENISPKFSSKLFKVTFFTLNYFFSKKDSVFSPFTPYIVFFCISYTHCISEFVSEFKTMDFQSNAT